MASILVLVPAAFKSQVAAKLLSPHRPGHHAPRIELSAPGGVPAGLIGVRAVGVVVALSSAGFIPLQGISPLAALLQSSRTESVTHSFCAISYQRL